MFATISEGNNDMRLQYLCCFFYNHWNKSEFIGFNLFTRTNSQEINSS